MKSWPPLEVVLLTVALALALVPLYGFTMGRRPAEPPAAIAPADPGQTALEVWTSARFAHPPERFRVSHLGKTLWSMENEGRQSRISGKIRLELVPEGVDLRVEAEWPENTPETVMELTLEPEEMEGLTRSAWSTGTLDAILTYQWP